ncbi:MAG: long-chain fatty acid--CoA ligase, partial [Gammaproteobacteria bacterium]
MADAPILLDGVTTLYALFRERVRRTPGATAYLHARDGGWKALTWGEMGQRVVQLRERLAPFAGERMAIWMRNGPEWIACDQAALSLGMAVVPLYNEDRPENIAYILKDAGVRLLVVQDQKRLKRLEPFIEGLSLTCLAAHDLPPWGGSASRLPEGEEGELATLIYTSGTTGNPKGVMLTHRNILWVCSRALQVLQVFPQDRFLSILPFSHALERAGSYIIPMMAGAQVAFNRSIPLLREDLQAVRPTVMIAVPRLFERLYMRVEKGLSSHPLKKRVFQAAASVGWRRFLLQQGRGQWHPGLLLHSLLDRLAGRPFRAQMGGRLRVVVSGGAPLPLPVARLFIGLGLPILQGYGLTEASPVISVNTLEDNDPESVGRPLPGWEVRIGEGGELCVRGGG